MRFLRNKLDQMEPSFHKGGKLEKFYALFEAIDTALYKTPDVTKTTSHVRDGIDLKRIMMTVFCLALLPAFYGMYNIGYQANSYLSEIQTDKFDRATMIVVHDFADEPDELIPRLTESRAEQAQWAERLKEAPNDTLEAMIEVKADMMFQQELEKFENWRYGFINNFDANDIGANIMHGLLYFLPLFIVVFGVGIFWEYLFASRRGHEINEGFFVTSILFTLTLPATIPLWQAALGITFGVVVAKEVFGGTGKNFVNPALAGRAFLYFAYPATLSGDSIWLTVDGITHATPLAVVAADGMSALSVSYSDAFFGNLPGSIGEGNTFLILLCGAVLMATGIASWRIVLGTFVGMVAMTLICNVFGNPESNPMMAMGWEWHLALGGFAFGMMFMATDPVSASMTDKGKIWFGLLIGFMTVLIRVVNPAYPCGVMLAILFANLFAPIMDYFVTQSNIKRRLSRV